jgi:hydroxyethylthiazole kinase
VTEIAAPWRTLRAIRERAPLVQNITNLVAMDLSANLLLAAGASPAMVHDAKEVEDFIADADALTVNIGTLSGSWVEAMTRAARRAVELGKPWILDPVGVGTTGFRREVGERLAGLQPTVIRGNGAEIMTLGGGAEALARGVESDVDSVEALDAAHSLARTTGAVVAVTGVVDYVADGEAIVAVANGHALMTRVTALGCALTSLIGACCAVGEDSVSATAHGLAILGVAGELAAAEAAGPAAFRVRLIDALYNLDEPTLSDMARIQ